jgi:hypothetical protein
MLRISLSFPPPCFKQSLHALDRILGSWNAFGKRYLCVYTRTLNLLALLTFVTMPSLIETRMRSFMNDHHGELYSRSFSHIVNPDAACLNPS